jgi:hypothetical protein
MMEETKKSTRTQLAFRLFQVLPIVAVVCIIVSLYFYVSTFPGALLAEHDKWGQFGDYIGGILNPVFGFFGLIALLATLALQSEELKLSTIELAKSAKALQQQHDVLTQQNFENTFFQLLRRYSELVSEFRYASQSGRQALTLIYRNELLGNSYNRLAPDIQGDQRAVTAYENFYENYRHELGHYFRTLYHIFRFVDKSPLSTDKKVIYCNIVRAQLSSIELCLLFYNSIWGEGKEGFKPLIEKYGILKHTNAKDLLDNRHKDNPNFFSRNSFLGSEEREVSRG